jgi:PleD family two-component response regulator
VEVNVDIALSQPRQWSPTGETEVAARAANAAVALHILAVDDDETSHELLADHLSEYEFRVTALPDGQAMPRPWRKVPSI